MNVLSKCVIRRPLPTKGILFKLLILIGCHCNRKTKFSEKIFFSEAITGMKLNLFRLINGFTLYINCVFIVVAHEIGCYGNFKICNRFIIGQVKMSIYFCVTADF